MCDMDIIPKNCIYTADNPPARGNYEDECSHGVAKALQMVLPKHPDVEPLLISWALGIKNPERVWKIAKDYHGSGFAILRKRYGNEGSLNPKPG